VCSVKVAVLVMASYLLDANCFTSD